MRQEEAIKKLGGKINYVYITEMMPRLQKGKKTEVEVMVTLAEITIGKVTVYGKARCSPSDNFQIKRGRMISLGRAIKELHKRTGANESDKSYCVQCGPIDGVCS